MWKQREAGSLEHRVEAAVEDAGWELVQAVPCAALTPRNLAEFL